jgi:uncharacterized glyoxalase superfamily protein PhnB
VTRFDGIAAVFLVDDVGATARWYRDMLGFVFDTFPDSEPFKWASVRCGRAEIMLQSSPGYQKPDLTALRPAGAWNAYLYIDDADGLFASLDGRATIRRAPCDQPYQMREFEIADPNGYVLVFGQDVSGPGAA